MCDVLLTKKSSSASQVLTDVDSTTSSCKFASKLADIDVSLSGVKVDKLGSDSSHVPEGIYRFFILQKFMCAYNLFYSNICINVKSICINKYVYMYIICIIYIYMPDFNS